MKDKVRQSLEVHGFVETLPHWHAEPRRKPEIALELCGVIAAAELDTDRGEDLAAELVVAETYRPPKGVNVRPGKPADRDESLRCLLAMSKLDTRPFTRSLHVREGTGYATNGHMMLFGPVERDDGEYQWTGDKWDAIGPEHEDYAGKGGVPKFESLIPTADNWRDPVPDVTFGMFRSSLIEPPFAVVVERVLVNRLYWDLAALNNDASALRYNVPPNHKRNDRKPIQVTAPDEWGAILMPVAY